MLLMEISFIIKQMDKKCLEIILSNIIIYYFLSKIQILFINMLINMYHIF